MKIKGGAKRIAAVLGNKTGLLRLRKDRKGNVTAAFMFDGNGSHRVRTRHALKAARYIQQQENTKGGGL